ncbi:MAG: Fe-Mn family superoxide dismutase [Bdellovibrionota bacterium]
MSYEARDYTHLLGNLPGFSDEQLKAHFELYRGYVKSTNEINDRLENSDRKSTGYAFGAYSELKRRLPVAYNGMWLHELYFDNLKADVDEDGGFREAVQKQWSSVKDWKEGVFATAKTGPGWVITALEQTTHELHTCFIAEHHIGWVANHTPIMVLDMWEHAYMIDFGIDKGAYLKSFMENLNWEILDRRFKAAIGDSRKNVNDSSRNLNYVHAAGGGIG